MGRKNFGEDFQHQCPKLLGSFGAELKSIDSSELKKLHKATRKMKKSISSIGPMPGQFIPSPPREKVLEKCASDAPTLSSSQGLRVAKDLVQSILLPANS